MSCSILRHNFLYNIFKTIPGRPVSNEDIEVSYVLFTFNIIYLSRFKVLDLKLI